MRELEFPFDSGRIMLNRKKIRNELLKDGRKRIPKKIAILGGSTTAEITDVLELFLLNYGILPEFYESDFGKYYEDILFDNVELSDFSPDIIYIHTNAKNIKQHPLFTDSKVDIERKLAEEFAEWQLLWDTALKRFHCVIIQNNFEHPVIRYMGNSDISSLYGEGHYRMLLNSRMYDYANEHREFLVNDIEHLSAVYGLDRWDDPFVWHMYKCFPARDATPELAFSIANIIKSLYGKNKKVLVTDLDNTLWSGVISEDGTSGIRLGNDDPEGEAYYELQSFIKGYSAMGVLLCVDSKNDEDIALSGLSHRDSVLRADDFTVIKANWNPKDENLLRIAEELNLDTSSFVFIDDNPAERHLIKENMPEVAVPELDMPEEYMRMIDHSGFFETCTVTQDDRRRGEQYRTEAKRNALKGKFTSYEAYLRSLEMIARITPFDVDDFMRISQLTNKSNQFNLTTLRCTLAEIEQFASSNTYITLEGRLKDRFGDSGIVAVTVGKIDEKTKTEFHIILWLMSCRVLKRNMEFAMMDALVEEAKKRGIKMIYGYYYPTEKNKMVENFYADMGFALEGAEEKGATRWKLENLNQYRKQNSVIEVSE